MTDAFVKPSYYAKHLSRLILPLIIAVLLHSLVSCSMASVVYGPVVLFVEFSRPLTYLLAPAIPYLLRNFFFMMSTCPLVFCVCLQEARLFFSPTEALGLDSYLHLRFLFY